MLISVIALVAATAGPAKTGNCDRACLVAATDSYLAALVSHDPAAVPLKQDVLLVENVTRIKPGEGLWATAGTQAGALSLHVPDPVTQAAGWFGVMQSGGKPVLVAIRLKFDGGKIAEAEHLVGPPLEDRKVANLRSARAGLVRQVARGQRLSRDRLVAIGSTYYDALDENKGSLAPFAKDCERQDNGDIAVGPNVTTWPEPDYPHIDMTCGGQLDSQVMSYIDTIDDRRIFAVDPVYGLAIGLSHFRHRMGIKDTQVILPDGSRGVRKLTNGPFDVVAAHVIKIGPEGKIHEIEAMGIVTPYMSGSGRD